MSSWGNKDSGNNAPKFVTTVSGGIGIAYTASNIHLANTICVSASRLAAANAQMNISGKQFAHTGWNRIVKGTGGRAGRIQTECLAVLSTPIINNGANSANQWFTL